MENRLTEKSMEALQAAQRLTAKSNHQQLDVEHLLLSLLEQERGLAPSMLRKAEVAVATLAGKLRTELDQ